MKVAEWQQTYYSSDSGIQSGATTVRTDDDGADYGSKQYTITTTVSADNAAGRSAVVWAHPSCLCVCVCVCMFEMQPIVFTICALNLAISRSFQLMNNFLGISVQ